MKATRVLAIVALGATACAHSRPEQKTLSPGAPGGPNVATYHLQHGGVTYANVQLWPSHAYRVNQRRRKSGVIGLSMLVANASDRPMTVCVPEFRIVGLGDTPLTVVAVDAKPSSASVRIPPLASQKVDLLFPAPAGQVAPVKTFALEWAVTAGDRSFRERTRFTVQRRPPPQQVPAPGAPSRIGPVWAPPMVCAPSCVMP